MERRDAQGEQVRGGRGGADWVWGGGTGARGMVRECCRVVEEAWCASTGARGMVRECATVGGTETKVQSFHMRVRRQCTQMQ